MGRRTDAPRDAAEVAALTDVLREQWEHLRAWLDGVPPREARRLSALAGWTVVELVAHLGRSLQLVVACTPADRGTEPISLGRYIGQYATSAEEDAGATRDQAALEAADPLGALDRHAAQAFARLDELRAGAEGTPDPVVLARRGPVRLSDLVVTRILELVVHGDDLARSIGGDDVAVRRVVGEDGPVLPRALDVAAEELLDVVVGRGGWDLEVADALRWVRLAAGRRPYDVDELARALAPRHTSEAVPDLGTHLPVL